MKKLVVFPLLLSLCCAVQARHNSEHPLSAEDWQAVMSKVVLLEDSGLMPTLLPVIMRNRDTLALTDAQVEAFRAWRKKNYTTMVNVMNEIIEKMVQFRVEALSPGVSAEHLLAFQSDIHDLQRRLLELKLSCRQLVMETFTPEQWESFAFVIADNPRLASLAAQANGIELAHTH